MKRRIEKIATEHVDVYLNFDEPDEAEWKRAADEDAPFPARGFIQIQTRGADPVRLSTVEIQTLIFLLQSYGTFGGEVYHGVPPMMQPRRRFPA